MPEIETPSFGTEVAKAFTISAAVAAGTVAGMIAIGAAITVVDKINDARKAKKTEE